jgi:hypothetical protein
MAQEAIQVEFVVDPVPIGKTPVVVTLYAVADNAVSPALFSINMKVFVPRSTAMLFLAAPL